MPTTRSRRATDARLRRVAEHVPTPLDEHLRLILDVLHKPAARSGLCDSDAWKDGFGATGEDAWQVAATASLVCSSWASIAAAWRASLRELVLVGLEENWDGDDDGDVSSHGKSDGKSDGGSVFADGVTGCWPYPTDQVLRLVSRSCPELRELTLGSTLGSDMWGRSSDMKAFRKWQPSNAVLRAVVRGCPSLRRLSLHGCHRITPAGLKCLQKLKLEKLLIEDCFSLGARDQWLGPGECGWLLRAPEQLGSSLRELHLVGCEIKRAQQVKQNTLTRINLADTIIATAALECMLPAAAHLQDLCLGDLDDGGLAVVGRHCKTLQTLELTDTSAWQGPKPKPADWSAVRQGCPALAELTVDWELFSACAASIAQLPLRRLVVEDPRWECEDQIHEGQKVEIVLDESWLELRQAEKLRRLETYWPLISTDAVSALLSQCPRLELSLLRGWTRHLPKDHGGWSSAAVAELASQFASRIQCS